jgi:signal transduction histidine kinase
VGHGLDRSAGGLPTVEVTNAGPVVERGQIEELVKPFYRAEENGHGAGKRTDGHGLGLGLSIVQAIAQAHGATLETQACPEGGLRVTVAFPADGRAGGGR